jgi:hypothetical protein
MDKKKSETEDYSATHQEATRAFFAQVQMV